MKPLVVVMGVSGCGKSTVGAQFATSMGLEFLEGDRLHSPRNVARMASGIALTDDDRKEWLELLSDHLAQAAREQRGLVVACSALKRSYRDVLRRGAPDLLLVHLTGTQALLAERTADRPGHYMPASLLASQIATLETPQADEHVLTFDVARPPASIVQSLVATLASTAPPGSPPGPTADHSITREQGMTVFTKVILFTDTDGCAKFREERVPLSQGTPQSMLSTLYPSGGFQLRESPVGFRSQFHCTGAPQWVFILRGQMEIGLQGGVSRVFHPGDHFYSADVLPDGAVFDARIHGHWSRQAGPDPLVTLFVRG